ncbi:Selenocysteine-specific elongation factor [Spironucleus salmonicida]|uniref:Selenocysteine-specific elongation factor n=1 Tax=Spironucleus salmonicida TaxID=348837 RepID=V6LT03_9EUKA|nr:Selenocysteine-specific elongation factor [Spironucleus salmonicida]|eukprot:EST47777.1 Selenocysteine-specific elongation factor [Spironucleus salmonicida]
MNVSIGLLGHVDSGKTALARALSTTLSTAALDKHPESQRRGITLDIGISQFDMEDFHITVVDCPGHASFLKTVLAGASIIQALLLLVDLSKGPQIQTVEALIIAEALGLPVLAVLNKADLHADNAQKTQQSIEALAAKIGLKNIAFCTAAAAKSEVSEVKIALLELLNGMKDSVLALYAQLKTRPLLLNFDHTFPQKAGTILTGTLIQGVLSPGTLVQISPGSTIHNGVFTSFPIKSIQKFKKGVETAFPGDRVGVQIAGVQVPSERGILCQSMTKIRTVYATIRMLKSYKNGVSMGQIFSVNLGALQVKARLFVAGVVKKKMMNKMLDNAYKPKQEFDGIIIFEEEIDFVDSGKILGVRTDFCAKTNQSTSRIAFVGQICSVSAQIVSSIQYEQDRKYTCVIDKVVGGKLVIKKIDGIGEKTAVGMTVYQGSKEVGVVEREFGQGKWKADITEEYNSVIQEEIWIGESVLAEWKTGFEQ